MRLMPILFVRDVTAARRFFAVLGLRTDATGRAGGWIELAGDGGLLGLHTVTDTDEPRRPGECALSFVADEPLEAVRDRLHGAGHADAHIIDEGYGRSLRVTGPDGAPVQVVEHDRALYT
ncbi:MAG TPA: hypothetical protein VGN37_12970 [Actinocatenispora sp.]